MSVVVKMDVSVYHPAHAPHSLLTDENFTHRIWDTYACVVLCYVVCKLMENSRGWKRDAADDWHINNLSQGQSVHYSWRDQNLHIVFLQNWSEISSTPHCKIINWPSGWFSAIKSCEMWKWHCWIWSRSFFIYCPLWCRTVKATLVY